MLEGRVCGACVANLRALYNLNANDLVSEILAVREPSRMVPPCAYQRQLIVSGVYFVEL